MRCGVVDVGGGLRGIYAAGVLDRCMDDGVRFDVGIGVSAGSANMASYAAGQRGRNYRFFAEYAFRGRYMGVGNFLRRRSFVNLDYVYGTHRVVLVLTKPEEVRRTSDKDRRVAAFIRPRHPQAAQRLCERATRYNESVEKAQRLAAEGKVLIVAPDDTCGVDTLKRDRAALDRLYEKGLHDGGAVKRFLQDAR